jgi:hypothetical protein
MAAKGQSNAERLSRWELIITNAKPSLGEMPHLEDDVRSLESKLGEVRTLESRQEDLRSQAREVTARIRVVTREGEKVRTRLGASLKGKLGFGSETLVKYGIRPRPSVVRRRAKDPKDTKAAEPQPAVKG